MNATQSNAKGRQSKQAFWKQHIEDLKHSGKTQVQYCLEHQLKVPTLQYWKLKFDQENRSHTLLPVSITPDDIASTSGTSGISFSLKGGFIIHLEERFNSQTLAKLIDVLRA